jgi:hypothetical protein
LLREVFDGCVASAAANTADTAGHVFDANTEDLIEALKANGTICRVLGLPQHDPAVTYSTALIDFWRKAETGVEEFAAQEEIMKWSWSELQDKVEALRRALAAEFTVYVREADTAYETAKKSYASASPTKWEGAGHSHWEQSSSPQSMHHESI